MEIVKTCDKHGPLTIKDISAQKYKKRNSVLVCRHCKRELYKIWAMNNIEKVRAHRRKYYHRHKHKPGFKEKYMARKNAWRAANNKQSRAAARAYYSKNRIRILKYLKERRIKNLSVYKTYRKKSYEHRKNTLSDGYVKELIRHGSSLKCKDIPIEMVEAKRVHVKLIRKIKELRNGNNQC